MAARNVYVAFRFMMKINEPLKLGLLHLVSVQIL
jgi:hypothetical protein